MAENIPDDKYAADDGSKSETYEVGYKRPPKSGQFKPGQSGNRKGRPKGSLNFDTLLERELNSSVSVAENGRRKQVRKKEVIVKQLVNKAAAGELRATTLLMNEVRAREGAGVMIATASQDVSPEGLAREDQKTIDSILTRLRQAIFDQAQMAQETRVDAGVAAEGGETSEGGRT